MLFRVVRSGVPILLLLAGMVASARAVDSEKILPEGTSLERYRLIWTRSPFTIASAAAAGPMDNGAWVLVGLAVNGKAPLAFLLDRQNQDRMTVTLQPNEKGFSIDSIEDRPNLQSIVKVKTPSEVLTLRFDPALTTGVNNGAATPAAPNPYLLHPPGDSQRFGSPVKSPPNGAIPGGRQGGN